MYPPRPCGRRAGGARRAGRLVRSRRRAPRAGAARGSRARLRPAARATFPPSTSSGIGTEDGPEVSTSGAACGLSGAAARAVVPPFPPEPRCPPPRLGRRIVVVPASDRAPPGELPAQRRLQRARDDVLGVGVVADVVRDRVDRLLVAVERIEAVDAAVVEPVGEHLLAARVVAALRGSWTSAATALRASASSATNVRRRRGGVTNEISRGGGRKPRARESPDAG